MTLAPAAIERLRFLARVAHKEARHLALTTERLFTSASMPSSAASGACRTPSATSCYRSC